MSSSLSTTILEFLRNVFGDEDARAEFLANPEGYLADNGLDDLSCADFDDALVSFFDNSRVGDNNLGGNFHNTVPHPGQSDSEAISEHLTRVVHEYGDTYITNYDNDVVNDNSFNGTIISDGDVTIDNDITSASGDGAVAAGDDIDGPTNTGDIDSDNSGINFGDGSTVSGGDDISNDNDTSYDNDYTYTDNSDNSNNSENLNNVGNDSSTDTDVDFSYDDHSSNDVDNDVDYTDDHSVHQQVAGDDIN